MNQKKKNILIVAILVAVVILLAAVWMIFRPQGVAGEKQLGISVVDAEGNTEEFSFSTSQEFLRGALEEQGLVQGEESQYGLYVTTVNGLTADESQQQWWCFTKGGEDVMTGVDSTPIADGDHFEITLKTGY